MFIGMDLPGSGITLKLDKRPAGRALDRLRAAILPPAIHVLRDVCRRDRLRVRAPSRLKHAGASGDYEGAAASGARKPPSQPARTSAPSTIRRWNSAEMPNSPGNGGRGVEK